MELPFNSIFGEYRRPSYAMAIKNKKNGFALLIAIIFMSVVLALGLALGALGYKQQVLALGAIESQYSFYVADAALECTLYADQQQNLFTYALHDANNPPTVITCDNTPATQLNYAYDATRMYVSERLSIDSNMRCADITIYKYKNPQPPTGVTTYIFSQGYDVPCTTINNPQEARFVSRGINAHY